MNDRLRWLLHNAGRLATGENGYAYFLSYILASEITYPSTVLIFFKKHYLAWNMSCDSECIILLYLIFMTSSPQFLTQSLSFLVIRTVCYYWMWIFFEVTEEFPYTIEDFKFLFRSYLSAVWDVNKSYLMYVLFCHKTIEFTKIAKEHVQACEIYLLDLGWRIGRFVNKV